MSVAPEAGDQSEVVRRPVRLVPDLLQFGHSAWARYPGLVIDHALPRKARLLRVELVGRIDSSGRILLYTTFTDVLGRDHPRASCGSIIMAIPIVEMIQSPLQLRQTQGVTRLGKRYQIRNRLYRPHLSERALLVVPVFLWNRMRRLLNENHIQPYMLLIDTAMSLVRQHRGML